MRGFQPRTTGNEQQDLVQGDLARALRELGQRVDSTPDVTPFVESREALPTDALLAFKGPAGQTLTLAPAHMPTAGKVRTLILLNFATVALTVAAPGGDTINGGASVSLGAGKAATVYTDGESAHLAIVGFGQSDIAFPADATDFGSFKHIPAGGALTMHYFANASNSTVLTAITYAIAANNMYAVPFIAPGRGGTLDRIQFEATAGVTNDTKRVCVYAATSESNLHPAAKVVEGTVATNLGVAVYTVTVSAPLTGGGVYWLTFNSPTTITLRGIPTDACSALLGTTATPALTPNTHLFRAQAANVVQPDPFPASGALLTGAAPMLAYRVS